MKERIKWIDSLKGFAAILVVIGHVADGYLNSNTLLGHGDILKLVFNGIYSFHLPLFFIISGFVVSNAYIKNSSLNRKKVLIQIKNLIYLYLFFSILQWCVKYSLGSLNIINHEVSLNNLKLILIEPMSPYWYLYDLIIFYIILILFDKINLLKKNIVVFLMMIYFILSMFDSNTYIVLKIIHLIYYFIFFYLGVKMNEKHICKKYCVISIVSLLILNVTYIIFLNSEYIRDIRIFNFLFASFCSYVIICLFKKYFSKKYFYVLNYVGKNSLELYVLHCYLTTFFRVFLVKINITNFYVNFSINSLFSIILTLAFVEFIKKINIHNYLFYPFKKEVKYK